MVLSLKVGWLVSTEDQKPAEVPFAVQPAALLTVTVESVESSAVTHHAVLRKQHPKRMRRLR